ncbi:MAG: hypothetical protein ACRD29_24810 [Acidimicrobiales bacterium]
MRRVRIVAILVLGAGVVVAGFPLAHTPDPEPATVRSADAPALPLTPDVLGLTTGSPTVEQRRDAVLQAADADPNLFVCENPDGSLSAVLIHPAPPDAQISILGIQPVLEPLTLPQVQLPDVALPQLPAGSLPVRDASVPLGLPCDNPR